MQNYSDESILAQEQAVIMRGLGVTKELEAEVGLGETEGTLVLTNKRLIFVCTNEKEEDVHIGYTPLMPTAHLLFSDVEDLSEIPDDPRNTFIPISSVTSAVGLKGRLAKPKLEVRWTDGIQEKGAEFSEVLTGKRKRNLNDLGDIIQRLKRGELKIVSIPKAPPIDTVEGKVVHVLSDMQEKGVFSIEEEVEQKFSIKVDPDEIQSACDTLTKNGTLDKVPDSSGYVFYRKRSALGDDDFSS
jgi:hypothetical protein